MKYSSKIYRRFRHGHKFFRYLLLDRILNKKDNFVLITGKRGSGKTTLGIKLIMGFTDIKSNEEYYNEEKNVLLGDSEKVEYSFNDFTPFNMEKHICFSKQISPFFCYKFIRFSSIKWSNISVFTINMLD